MNSAKKILIFTKENDTVEPVGGFRQRFGGKIMVDLRPGVTVCIASHPARTKTWLMPALQSVLSQTRQPDAILVVNDIGAQGAGWTRRTLLEAVQTEWIAWLDSDDEWYPEHLEKCLNHALETGAVYVYCLLYTSDAADERSS